MLCSRQIRYGQNNTKLDKQIIKEFDNTIKVIHNKNIHKERGESPHQPAKPGKVVR